MEDITGEFQWVVLSSNELKKLAYEVSLLFDSAAFRSFI